ARLILSGSNGSSRPSRLATQANGNNEEGIGSVTAARSSVTRGVVQIAFCVSFHFRFTLSFSRTRDLKGNETNPQPLFSSIGCTSSTKSLTSLNSRYTDANRT